MSATEVALALMLVEAEAELFVKRYKRYVDRDDIDLPDCSDLEQALAKLKEARRKNNANNSLGSQPRPPGSANHPGA